MSKSGVVGLFTGVVLFAALGVVAHHYKYGIEHRVWWVLLITFGLGIYGAALTAVSLRRVIDPKLDTPWLAALLALAWYLFAAFAKEKNRHDRGLDSTDDDDRSSSSSSKNDDDTMGLGWAIFSTFIGLLMVGAAITLVWAFAKHPSFAYAKPTPVATPAEAPAPTPAPIPTPAPEAAPPAPEPTPAPTKPASTKKKPATKSKASPPGH